MASPGHNSPRPSTSTFLFPSTSRRSLSVAPLTDETQEREPLIDRKTSMDNVESRGRPALAKTGLRQSFMDDPALKGLSLFERKAHLVNRELDSHGMGKYQWYIWGLCGLGYFIDLLFAQAFGLIEPAIQQEFGFGDEQSGNLFSSFSAGLTAGAFVWGVLVDIIGRRWAFQLTVLIASVFGLCMAAPSTYDGVLVLVAFVGFGVGGNIPIDTTICLEFLPQKKRYLLALLSAFQPLGVVAASGIAAGLIPKYSCGDDANGDPLPACTAVAAGQACCTKESNMGWRYTMLTIGGLCVVVFILRSVIFRFYESPKFYLTKGQDDKAVEVLHKVAKFNSRESSITSEHFYSLDETQQTLAGRLSRNPTQERVPMQRRASYSAKVKDETSRYKLLFSSPKMGFFTVLVWITYAFDYWGFSIAGGFLPKILLAKNSAINVSLEESYRNFVIIYFPGIFGVLLGGLMYVVPRVGRKYAMIGSSALMGISLFLFSTVNTQASNIGLNIMEYFFQSMFNAVLYGWTPEAFPAPVRGTACGIASFWGRLFSIVSPLIAANLLTKSLNGPLYLAGGGVFVCTIAISLMPSGTMESQSY